jgi:hypothetical protein
MVLVCPTCHGRFGGPLTHLHLSRVHDPMVMRAEQPHDPRFASCDVCHGYGRIETCDTCEGKGRVERVEDGSLKPARDVAELLNQQAMAAWDGAPGHKLRRK